MTLARSFFDLFPNLGLIEITDVGALPLADHIEVYAPLLKADRARVTAFEPDEAGCKAAQEALGAAHRCFPYFIADGKPRTFYETNIAATGSLYPPNQQVLDLLPDVAPYVRLKATHPVQTRRLDEITEIERIDFLKLDVQGAELDVIKGAGRLLDDVLVIHTEVEFLELYKGQPLFSEIEHFLRGQGFQFHAFMDLAKRFIGPLRSRPGEITGYHQTVWADAVFVRDLTMLSRLAPKRQFALAAIMHEVYESADVSLHILQQLNRQGYPCDIQQYWQQISG